ncbi:S-layer homology domain-containing protein [Paenibacillus radicis (ex Xue et al. 2023)]|uniref:S-layer homology domain-containing protein n=1 Tax=Paenibacillus radicis (ex Xue et al. 2023) TaxID=2972489 RepID=A0ABT1YMY2_9BACL|nr:S-layer homology domain-containing protein [Paenibacillus radicis (ex Xue et al. 2023)]MCR8634516.1 S-layer homology domain-containing protein [Paenibacillus radicis (ex Xue et al. 2023)]
MNHKKNQTKKVAAGLVALSVLMSSPVYAADSITNPTSTSATSVNTTSAFSDVSTQHWAIKYVTKLAALGIIQGYERNEYRPENPVSQQEVIVMAIRMMGLESEALKSKSETILPVAVDSFFKPYIAYAFDKQLLDIKEETDTSGAASKTAWGSRSASREWVAKLVIRAIGKQGLAQEKALTPSIFKDDKDLSSWAVGYVNAAVSLKIVNGVDDNNFQPKGAVTRAQMATFLSRADKELTTRSDKVSIGYVMGLTNNKLSIQNERGQSSDFTINSNTVIYNAKDDSRIASSALKETYEVYVIQNQGAASYIELMSDQEKMGSLEGSLNQLFLPNMQIAINQASGVELKELAPNVTVTDKDGRGLSLGSIVQGSIIELKWNLLVPNAKISQIIVKQTPVSKTGEGTIISIQKDQNTITFMEKASGKNETFALGPVVPVKLPDQTAADISKLRVGDEVAYDIKANQITGVAIRKQADVSNTVQGTLISLSDDKKNMTINIGGKSLGAYFVAENALVTIDGLPSAGLFDIVAGDELKIELVNEKVVKVNVTSRSIKEMSFATMGVYDSENKVLTGIYDNGDVFAYKLTENTVLKVGSRTYPLTDFSTNFHKGDKIDLKVSKDKVISIQLTEQLEGTLTQVNTTTNEVSIRTASGQSITFKVQDNLWVSFWSNTNGTLKDLKIGDQISARIRSSQDVIITQISVKKTGVYKILMVNSDSRQVNAEDEAGSLYTFKVDNDNIIINANKITHTFGDIQQDDYLKVSYNGNVLTSVTILKTVRGKVTGVDTAAGTITVQDFANGIQAIPVGQKFVIKQGGVTSAALTAIKPNDRVEIISDTDDKTYITVADATKRTVSSYDIVLNQIVLKPTANGDKTTYNLYSKAYLHKGTNIVAPNAFVENDEVNVFVIANKIIELEK